ncbi:hypothetical protein [Sorangium sp. So ce124]|uniref:hypothetical protein n=1 Tax=Sorangium sp. So ce124 TaxID=3133280 RepID=UPI003F60F983
MYVTSTAGRWLEILDRSEWLCAGYPLIVWLAFGLLALVLACSGPVPPRPPSPTVLAKVKTVRPPRISAPVLSRRVANAACYRRRDLSRPSGAWHQAEQPTDRLVNDPGRRLIPEGDGDGSRRFAPAEQSRQKHRAMTSGRRKLGLGMLANLPLLDGEWLNSVFFAAGGRWEHLSCWWIELPPADWRV